MNKTQNLKISNAVNCEVVYIVSINLSTVTPSYQYHATVQGPYGIYETS